MLNDLISIHVDLTSTTKKSLNSCTCFNVLYIATDCIVIHVYVCMYANLQVNTNGHLVVCTCVCVCVQYLSDIQEHLGVTIPEVDNSFDVPVNEFDGNITYGEKRRGESAKFTYHTAQLAPSLEQLTKMEMLAQSNFLRVQTTKSWFS